MCSKVFGTCLGNLEGLGEMFGKIFRTDVWKGVETLLGGLGDVFGKMYGTCLEKFWKMVRIYLGSSLNSFRR